jgi:hypothetical protein
MENDPSEGIREMTPSEGIKDGWQDFVVTPTDGKPDDLPVEIILDVVTPTLDPTEGIMYGHS